MGPVKIAAAVVLLLTGCGVVEDDRREPVASPEPVEETTEPVPTPEPEPESSEVEDPEPEPEAQVETQTARPDPARVRENIRAIFDQELGRQPGDDELHTAEHAWFDFWEAGRDAEAAWMEWFRDRYEAQLENRRRSDAAQRQGELMREGGSRAGCMTGGAGYDNEDC